MKPLCPALFASLAALSLPGVAAAQTFQLFGPDMGRNPYESAQNFGFELRFSPWQPAIDSEFTGGTGPFLDYFGTLDSDGHKRVSDVLLSAIEFDWQVLRVNPVGSLGLGVSA